jgi:hypothetical protein
MNPYAYVAENPETLNDPSGQMIDCGPGCGNGNPTPPPPNHGPTCGPDPSSCDGSGMGNPGAGAGTGGITKQGSSLSEIKLPTWTPDPTAAQNAAIQAAWNFAKAGGAFAALAAILKALAAFLAAASLPADVSIALSALGLSADALAIQLTALSNAAVMLAGEAAILAGIFYGQSTMSAQWFSRRSYVTSTFNTVNQIINVVAGVSIGLFVGISKLGIPGWILSAIGMGGVAGLAGMAITNVQLFRTWSIETEQEELHDMFGDTFINEDG